MKKIVCAFVMLVFTSLLLSSAVLADTPPSIPAGPWLVPDQEKRLDRLMTNEEVEERLFDIEARSKGRLEVEQIGTSATGWPIYVAKFGKADDEDKVKVFIETQIHGGEPYGTEAVMLLIQHLATSGNKDVKAILDNVTVWIIPRLNLDGAAFEVDGKLVMRRTNTQDWTPEEWGLAADAPAPWYWRKWGVPGYDLNRDFHPDLDFVLGPVTVHQPPGKRTEPGFYVTPEGRASRDVFKALQPDVFIDHHHRGSNTVSEEDISLCTLQIIAQVVDEVQYPLDPAVLKLSKQINSYVYIKLNELGNSPFGGITKYPTVNLPGTALGSYSLNGAAIMLYEVRSTGQKSSGMLIRQTCIGLYGTLLGLATGEIFDVDPTIYDDIIPEAGPWIRWPHI